MKVTSADVSVVWGLFLCITTDNTSDTNDFR